MVSREMPSDDGSVVTIGAIHGGEATNIICPSVVMEGTIRTRSPERRTLLFQRVREIAEGIAAMHRGRAECLIRTGEPPVANDAEMVQPFRQVDTTRPAPRRLLPRQHGNSGQRRFRLLLGARAIDLLLVGGRAPANESYAHTPTFGFSDDVRDSDDGVHRRAHS